MISLRYYFKNPKEAIHRVIQKCSWAIPAELYLKNEYYYHMGKKLNLKNPTTFGEKLQWLKLHDHNPIYHTMVDKYAVKKYISNVLGSEYVIPLLGVWDKAADIEWDKLPDQFVIKATHCGGGGAVFICKDKSSFDKEKVSSRLQLLLDKIDLYERNGEWAYKGIPHRIIAEKYMEDTNGQLNDYKILCFNGDPQIIIVDADRYIKHKRNFYDRQWNIIPIESDCEPIGESVGKPGNLNEMLGIARKLSKGIPFVRVDLYSVKGTVYFGELTFYPWGGFISFKPDKYNDELGALIQLR